MSLKQCVGHLITKTIIEMAQGHISLSQLRTNTPYHLLMSYWTNYMDHNGSPVWISVQDTTKLEWNQ
jgi:hypothetical protein